MKKISEFGEALTEALDKKNNSVDNMVWKWANGNVVKMTDMTEDELKKAYNHCVSMLYSTSSTAPGKYQVRKNYWDMYSNCNAELLLRYLLYTCKIDNLKTNKDIVDLVNLYRREKNIKDNDPITVIFENMPTIFEKVTIEKLVRACLDSLNPFNKKLVPNEFILSKGIWFTNKERKELTEYREDGSMRNRLEVLKERLLMEDVRLRIDPKGFGFKEFRALIQLEPIQKYSTIPSYTLELLRDRVILMLDTDLEWHIQKWTKLLTNIRKVAEMKGFKVDNK